MKNKIIIGILFALCLTFLYKGCDSHRLYNEALSELSREKHSSQNFKELANSQGKLLVTQQANIVDKDSEIAKQADLIHELTSLSGQVHTSTEIVLVDRPIQVVTTEVHTDIDSVIIYQEHFPYADQWVQLSVTQLTDSTASLDSLKIQNDVTVQWGEKKNWLLGRKKPTVLIENSNPYLHTLSMNSYIFEDNPKWYERDGWKIVAAVVLGAYVDYQFNR